MGLKDDTTPEDRDAVSRDPVFTKESASWVRETSAERTLGKR